jgi:uncharacterized protein YggT (Ycf19 family)
MSSSFLAGPERETASDMLRDSETGLVFHHGTLWRSPIVPRLIQVVGFLFGLLYLLLAIRFVLEYVEARPVPFVQAIDRWSDVFYAPFRGIVANGHDGAGHPIAWSLVIAFGAYVILHAAIVALLRMARARDDD